MQAIIERTAVFVAKQGKQMEILVKAKQSGNPQFDFLLMDNWLNPYYKHVLQYVTEGKYVPEIPKQPSAQAQEESKESDNDDSEDDSDGEYELHPLLQASLHKKITRSQPSSVSSSPIPHTLGNKFNRTFAPVTSGLNSTALPHDQNDGSTAHFSGVKEMFDYSMWYPQGMYMNAFFQGRWKCNSVDPGRDTWTNTCLNVFKVLRPGCFYIVWKNLQSGV